MWNVRLSPDGSKVSYLTSHASGVTAAMVWELEGGKPAVVLASEQERAKLSWCGWANNERLLCGYRAVLKWIGDYQYASTLLFAVAADGSERRVLMQRKLRHTRVWATIQDDLIDWLPDDPEHVLLETPGARGTGVTRLNIYTGSTETEERVRESVFAWRSDHRGAIRLRYSHDPRGETKWRYRAAGEKKWRDLHKSHISDLRDVYRPAALGTDPNELLVYARSEGRVALWSEDLANDRARKLVFAHPDVDVWGGMYLGKYRRMVAVGYDTDREHLHFFDRDVERIRDKLAVLYPDQDVRVVDESWDRRFYLIFLASDQAAGSYFRFDNVKSVLAKISSSHPQLDGVRLAAMTPTNYAARDGEEISAYLTLPIAGPKGPLPAVIMPHGGWQSRDYWGYNWIAQYLAARGYAVLQANFRGSGGFGLDWWSGGAFRNWRVAVQDVTDGTRHLVEQGIVDPARICILGWQIGGYAALLSAVEEPELYRCVVSIAGVSDLPLIVADSRGHYLKRALTLVGEDREERRRGSPARRAGEVRAPVLLFHGYEDLDVRVEHSRKMAKELRRKKKTFEYIEYEHAGESIWRSDDRRDMLTRIGALLDRTTAPRASARGASAAASR